MVTIQNVVMTGADVAYTVPAQTSSIAFKAVGGDIAMRKTGGGPAWTLKDGWAESIDARSISGEVFLFNGAAGTVTLQVRILSGILC